MSSAILTALARTHESSQAGRTGRAELDFQPEFHILLKKANAETGAAHTLAVSDLERAERLGILRLQRHPKDRAIIEKVRLSLTEEAAFYRHLGCPSPAQKREACARQLQSLLTVTTKRY